MFINKKIYLTKIFILSSLFYSINTFAVCKDNEADEFQKFIDSQGPSPTLIFFSTWCSDCKKELEKIQKEKMKNYILINSFDKKGNGDKILKKMELNYPCFFDTENKIAKKYNVKNVPAEIKLN